MPGLQVEDIQGILLKGYGQLTHASYLMLAISDPALARGWLSQLDICAASVPSAELETCTNIALAPSGMRKLGLSEEALSMFAGEWREGMAGSAHRKRMLGDAQESGPERWSWGGPDTATIDLLLMCYAAGEAAFERAIRDHTEALDAAGLELIAQLDATTLPGGKEHFGFRDGISQPAIEGHHDQGPAHNRVAAGEFVLGYPNAYGQYTDRPLLDSASDPGALLPTAPDDPARRDLGMNGSYLVFRQLSQDVAAFWQYADAKTRSASGERDAAACLHLASKMVGRWPSGAPLVKAPDADDPALKDENDFLYYGSDDPDGLKCPIGAHVRRTHPRDALDPKPGSPRSIEVGKRHRILRRGRPYGLPLVPSMEPEDVLAQGEGADASRGLHFICFNTHIGRQFEFIQHTWANSPKFDGLYQDDDPLIGDRGEAMGQPAGRFTVQAQPLRKGVGGMPRFVRVEGGGYFFLPGLRALRYLAALR